MMNPKQLETNYSEKSHYAAILASMAEVDPAYRAEAEAAAFAADEAEQEWLEALELEE